MKHFYKLLLLFTVLTLTSCSTIFATKTQKLHVFSNADKARVTVNDSIYNLPAQIYVARSKEPLEITYQSENKQIDTVFKAKHSPLFYLGNILNAPALGAGYVVDLTNQKRFKYRKNIFFNDKDSLEIYEFRADRYLAKHHIADGEQKQHIHEKFKKDYLASDANRKIRQEKEFKRLNPTEGSFRFNIQPPTLFLVGLSNKNGNINSFSNTVGGAGFGLGFDYYYKNDRFIGLETSVRGNLFDIMWWSSYDIKAFKYDMSLRKGHRWKRYEVSYGVSFVYTDYDYKVPYTYQYPITTFTSDDNKRNYDVNYRSLGFSTLLNYQLTSVMFVGLRYNPSVYSFRKTGNGFDYEHVIGIDYRIKF